MAAAGSSHLRAAPPANPQALFDQAGAADLRSATREDALRAFALYRSAAAAGLAQAQLNVAVMYDSGRGVARDAGQAAIWYAAAAIGGVARAAFDLGQLYEAGDGVPQNAALARAWFNQAAAQGLAAASGRVIRAEPVGSAVGAPTLRYPASAAIVPPTDRGLVLVWTAPPISAPATFFVQVMALGSSAPAPAFSTTTVLSAVRMFPAKPGRYAWRVFVLCPSLGRYVAGGWEPFSVG